VSAVNASCPALLSTGEWKPAKVPPPGAGSPARAIAMFGTKNAEGVLKRPEPDEPPVNPALNTTCPELLIAGRENVL
jgi:hypothetical protein